MRQEKSGIRVARLLGYLNYTLYNDIYFILRIRIVCYSTPDLLSAAWGRVERGGGTVGNRAQGCRPWESDCASIQGIVLKQFRRQWRQIRVLAAHSSSKMLLTKSIMNKRRRRRRRGRSRKQNKTTIYIRERTVYSASWRSDTLAWPYYIV